MEIQGWRWLLFARSFWGKLFFSFFCVGVSLDAYAATKKMVSPKIRVRLQKKLKSVVLSGQNLKRRSYAKNKWQVFRGRKKFRFYCTRLRRKVQKPIRLASLRATGGLISVGQNIYGGVLHIMANPKSNSCDLVQEMRLEDYLPSVLSKEMNRKWPQEALKAQAVAARSYAFYKKISTRKGRFYHLEK